MDFNICLFDDFETLDVFGPVEIFGRLPEEYDLKYFSMNGGIIESRQKTKIVTEPIAQAKPDGIFMIPGGQGTRSLIHDDQFMKQVKEFAEQSCFCITVCTGSALLAKTGLLKNRRATSNKLAFDWVKSIDTEVEWIPKARWVVDGKFYTSSGVSAGIDMSLGFVSDHLGLEKAQQMANQIEYIWNSDKNDDPFAR
ncbi:DJ-1/PfpI family protein [Paenibacillus terrae]|uniref:Dimethyladenosine transferase n=1 Tax=Paenibacillus terrae TaxID=159743 RepID=A0A0D7X639_9BACL|nr:DJ-1/PfpI family protein [Paenibacillus terrae]KJD46488.1 dimethyladenosine transferase [Paenibacillus terrae]